MGGDFDRRVAVATIHPQGNVQLVVEPTPRLFDRHPDIPVPVRPTKQPPDSPKDGKYQRNTGKDTHPGERIGSPIEYLGHVAPF